ncbi:MAG: GNAT family protein [Flavobacteriales bacterium]
MLTVRFSPFPILTTERLLLRKLVRSDAPAMFAMRSDPRVMQHIGRPRATALEDARKLIRVVQKDLAGDHSISWAITLKGDDTLIGTIGYYRLKLEHHRGEIGYMLSADHWRKGIMGEALDAAVACGFDRFGFHSIEADTDPLNVASNALLARHGFVREGLFKENFFWDGKYLDSAVWSRLAGR